MTFDDDLDTAQAVVYARYGVSAIWPGVILPVTVLMDQRDLTDAFASSQAVSLATIAKVRRAEVAAPAKGQTVVIGGVTYVLAAKPRCEDPRQREWTCELAVQRA